MNIAIVGAGLIGRKRAQSLPKGVKLILVCDTDKKKLEEFAKDFNCSMETNWKKVVKKSNVDAIVISTPNKYLAPIAQAAILEGKHVLIEKPGARNLKDLQKIVIAYKQRKVVVHFGYNHRFHPAIIKAKEIIDSKSYGPLLFIRARYGHGGRLGYEKEWRFNKDLAGGGELLDQGPHLIDLVNYFDGKMDLHSGMLGKLYWKSPLEDSAFIILKNKNYSSIASLSVTCIEWKNIFSFEIMLQTAKIQIDGLGRSYGQEKLTLYLMGPEMGPPKIKEFYFPKEDLSWKRETETFIRKVKSNDFSDQSLEDVKYVLGIIDKVYKSNNL